MEAVKEFPGLHILLVGQEEAVRKEVLRHHASHLPLSIVPASEVISMSESPMAAIKTKKNSSLVVTANLAKAHKAEAMVSAGNTGATMAAALMSLGRIKGVSRPAIATPMPSLDGGSVFLDAGANVDCKPPYLLEFAVMGNIYAREILKKANPRVGLLNIGEERGKGNLLVQEALPLFEKASFNFIGNVEGRDIINGKCDVIVCDGFIGNVVLKFGEGLAKIIFDEIRKGIMSNVFTKLGGLLVRPAFKNLRKKMDYSEYGGAPLLGVNGICIICHGSSSPKAIKNALRVASEFVRHHVNDHIREDIKRLEESPAHG